MRKVTYINDNWLYKPSFKTGDQMNDFDVKQYQEVELPHNNIDLPYNCFDENMYQFVSCYRRNIYISSEDKNKYIFVDFEGVMSYAKVYINGKYLGEHKGGYTPFSMELTDHLEFDQDNHLVVMVDSREREDIPPFGHVVDFLTYGGIYREVSLRFVEKSYVNHVFVKTLHVLETPSLEVDLELIRENDLVIEVALYDDDQLIKYVKKDIDKGLMDVSIEMNHLTGIELWSLEKPKLYDLSIKLYDNNLLMDDYKVKFGFRSAEFKSDGFYLNNKKVKLNGLNRHQSFPYVGYAMPERAQKKDADIIKYNLGLNIVRTSHYPQSRHFLDRCDEIGLMVFEEIPGWQHIGEKKWQEVSKQELREMIRRDCNRPSVTIWGVRVNESKDHHDFYTLTNDLARSLDPTRQTTGVRCTEGSEFLEDVYSMNDFVHSGHNQVLRKQEKVTRLKSDVPYLVSEHTGHMYPTKRFDHETRLIEHANRHLRVLNEQVGRQDITGAIGWCAFDYNTHKDFGSGDKICYHGVMDMFRIPKYAASVYSSQRDDEIIMDVASLIAKGERDSGGYFPIQVFTNCDAIKVEMAGSDKGTYYPDKKRYPHVKHAPIMIENTLGEAFERTMATTKFSDKDKDKFKSFVLEVMKGEHHLSKKTKRMLLGLVFKYRLKTSDIGKLARMSLDSWGEKDTSVTLIGVKNGVEVIRKTLGGMVYKDRLEVKVDDIVLSTKKSSYDVTRIEFKMLDQRGNLLPFSDDVLNIKLDGPGQIIGPNQVSLIGGARAVWVKTTGKKGVIKVSVDTPVRCDTISIKVK
ncbi:glycoside hydrolase family 2 protein [Acidaminobacter sp. JC074]|uniref:glycoside hydrolase family 2 protein n=1 Tax=Acidaminobacter sp. JC074 TaxID=2530199 RepID=UPI001F10A6B2|nr:glycoside hydrolase family 2 TIM barrel-domain containing protein [Acidaminobacter sp. JC074]MCH4890127.1 glycoside hydrolase family 2 protein [Acidaminobacter sp. JC074]